MERVKATLAALAKIDQETRTAFVDIFKLCGNESPRLESIIEFGRRVDEENLKYLKTILYQITWPRISEFGTEADHDAFLIAQHADGDPGYQKQVLTLLGDLVRQGETNADNYVLLADRVAESENKPQLYGTQGECKKGMFVPNNAQHLGEMNHRRMDLKLSDLTDYIDNATKLMCK